MQLHTFQFFDKACQLRYPVLVIGQDAYQALLELDDGVVSLATLNDNRVAVIDYACILWKQERWCGREKRCEQSINMLK